MHNQTPDRPPSGQLLVPYIGTKILILPLRSHNSTQKPPPEELWVGILTIFCIVFLNVNELYSFDKIKLRFKNINIENSIRKQNQDVYSKKLVNFLNSYFSDKGQMKNFVLNVSLDKYNADGQEIVMVGALFKTDPRPRKMK